MVNNKPPTWKAIAKHISDIEGKSVSVDVVKRASKEALNKMGAALAGDPLVLEVLHRDTEGPRHEKIYKVSIET